MLSITFLLLEVIAVGMALVAVAGVRRAVAGARFTRAMRTYEGVRLTEGTESSGAFSDHDRRHARVGEEPVQWQVGA